MRIALKNLHYTIEFVGSLFDKNEVRTFVRCLKSLRDDLGHANDVRVAYDLVNQSSEATDHDARAVNRAGGIVLGWYEQVLADRNPKVRKHVRRFRRLDPFWRGKEMLAGGFLGGPPRTDPAALAYLGASADG